MKLLPLAHCQRAQLFVVCDISTSLLMIPAVFERVIDSASVL